MKYQLVNYVEYNGMIMMVSGIYSPKPLKDKRYSDKYIIELFDGAGLLNCTIDEFEPIPLTEEWLLKMGFVKYKSDVRFYQNSSLKIKVHKNGYQFRWSESLVYVKYVHQLQNLYHALTNNELTTKL